MGILKCGRPPNFLSKLLLHLLLAGAGFTCIGTDWSVLCGVTKLLLASVDPKLALPGEEVGSLSDRSGADMTGAAGSWVILESLLLYLGVMKGPINS